MIRFSFYLFAIASFTRALILSLALLGWAPWSLVTRWPLMFAPQSVVFADPLFYNPTYLCIDHADGKLECLNSVEYVRDKISEHYVLGGGPFMHATIGVLRFFESDLAHAGEAHLLRTICKANVTGFRLSALPIYGPGAPEVDRSARYSCPL